MRLNNQNKIGITFNNQHLINVLNNAFFMELGTIDLNIVNGLFKGNTYNISELYENKILTSGTGKITNDTVKDAKYQIDFLKNYGQNIFADTYVISFGTVSFKASDETIYVSPIVLVPVIIDFKHEKIKLNGIPTCNLALLKYLRENRLISDADYDKLKDLPFSSVKDFYTIDNICLRYKSITGFSIGTVSYITNVETEFGQFIVNKDLLKTQHSINEINEFDLYKFYFENIRAIYPLNTEQKYVVYKAHNGESFVVDGRFGTGKTRTALNIIADAVSQNKKVLYVNCDERNINSLLDLMDKAGIGEFCQFLYQDKAYSQTNETTRFVRQDFNTEWLDKLKEDQKLFNQKYFGYYLTDIISTLAYYRARNLEHNIKIEHPIDRFEVENVNDILKDIEKRIPNIDNLSDNIWKNIYTSSANISVGDITNFTKTVYDTTKLVIDKCNEFTKEFHLKSVEQIVDATRYASMIAAVKDLRPLDTWKQKDSITLLYDEIDHINNYINTNNEYVHFYNRNTIPEYEKGNIKKLYDELNVDDVMYLERLFTNAEKLDILYDDLKLLVDTAEGAMAQLKAFYNINEITQEFVYFIIKLRTFIDTNVLNNSTVKHYVNAVKTYSEEKDQFIMAYEKYKDVKHDVLQMISQDSISYEEVEALDLTMTKRIFLKFFKIKESDYEFTLTLINELRRLGAILEKINPSKRIIRLTKEEQWKNYYELIKFSDSLNTHESYWFMLFLKKIKDVESLKDSVIYKRTVDLNSTYEELPLIKERILYYDLSVGSRNYSDIIHAFQSILTELKHYRTVRDEIKACFKEAELATPDAIKTLIDKDEDYKIFMKDLEDHHDYFTALFGKAYLGLDSKLDYIKANVRSYAAFLDYKADDYDLFFNDDIYQKLITHVDELNNLGNDWLNSLRDFSSCFNGGMVYLQNRELTYVLDVLQAFIDKIEQVPDVYVIEQGLETIRGFNLTNLPYSINMGTLTEKLCDKFTFAMMEEYELLLQDAFNKRDALTAWSKYVDEFYKNEEAFCTNNIISLRNQLNRDRLNLLLRLPFINETIRYSDFNNSKNTAQGWKKVFLANVKDLNDCSNITAFDLVIVDDAHLSNANKYSQIMMANQLIAFGDISYQSSVSNGLMQRLPVNTTLKLNKHYFPVGVYYQNYSFKDNKYLMLTDSNVNILPCATIVDMMKRAYNAYLESNRTKRINIFFGNYNNLFYCYKELYNYLIESKEPDIEKTLEYIRLCTANQHSQYACDETFIWFEDFAEQEQYYKTLNLQNILFCKNTTIAYTSFNQVFELYKMTGVVDFPRKEHHNIISILLKDLYKKGVVATKGFGLVDIYLKAGKNQIGLIIKGGVEKSYYSELDEYMFYKYYATNNLNLKYLEFNIEDLFNDYSKVLNKIVTNYKAVSNGK